MKKLCLTAWLALCFCGAIGAQERVQRVITIKNGNLGGILRTMRELLPGSEMLVSSDNEHLILVGKKETVAGFEEIVKQLDVPPAARNNVETTAYMVIASLQPTNAGVPAELDPVIAQLKSIFPYKGFRLLDSFVLRSRNGERGETSGFVATPNDRGKIQYTCQFTRVRIDNADSGKVVRYDHLSLHVNSPNGTNAKGEPSYAVAGLQTDVDVPEGKKVVVGKTGAVEGSDTALILVISAKVVD